MNTTNNDEHSGLHDIQDLARQSMERAAVELDDSAEHMISRSPALSGRVMLPKPTDRVQVPVRLTSSHDSGSSARKASEMPAVSPVDLAAASQTPAPVSSGMKKAVWVAVGGGACALALAVFGLNAASDDPNEVSQAAGDLAAVDRASDKSMADIASAAPVVEALDSDNGKGQEEAEEIQEVAAAIPVEKSEEANAIAPEAGDSKSTQAAPQIEKLKPADSEKPAMAKVEKNPKQKDAQKKVSVVKNEAPVISAAVKADEPKRVKEATKSLKENKAVRQASNNADSGMEDLLDQATGGPGPKKTVASKEEAAPTEDKPKLPKKLERAEVKEGMRSILPRVQACYSKHGQAGKAMVKVSISPDGSVSKSDVSGEFAGTPTGSCVADAVKKASFPPWDGLSLTISYPFLLE